MKTARTINGSLRANENLTQRDLDRLCSLIELLDRWDRELSTEPENHQNHNRARSKRRPQKTIIERSVPYATRNSS